MCFVCWCSWECNWCVLLDHQSLVWNKHMCAAKAQCACLLCRSRLPSWHSITPHRQPHRHEPAMCGCLPVVEWTATRHQPCVPRTPWPVVVSFIAPRRAPAQTPTPGSTLPLAWRGWGWPTAIPLAPARWGWGRPPTIVPAIICRWVSALVALCPGIRGSAPARGPWGITPPPLIPTWAAPVPPSSRAGAAAVAAAPAAAAAATPAPAATPAAAPADTPAAAAAAAGAEVWLAAAAGPRGPGPVRRWPTGGWAPGPWRPTPVGGPAVRRPAPATAAAAAAVGAAGAALWGTESPWRAPTPANVAHALLLILLALLASPCCVCGLDTCWQLPRGWLQRWCWLPACACCCRQGASPGGLGWLGGRSLCSSCGGGCASGEVDCDLSALQDGDLGLDHSRSGLLGCCCSCFGPGLFTLLESCLQLCLEFWQWQAVLDCHSSRLVSCWCCCCCRWGLGVLGR